MKYSSNNILRNKYVLLFPAFNEQKIVNDTCSYFEKWLAKGNQIEMIVIGDINETHKPTTAEMAEAYFKKSEYKNQFTTLICDKKKGSKASKINYALSYLKKKYKELPFLVVFDFDAKPSWEDFIKADEIMSKGNGQVYSFVPMIGEPTTNNFLLNSYLVNHYERVLVNELGSTLLPTYLRYPMGATMVLTPSLWNFIQNIPEPIDDLPLGYLLAKKRAQCISLPYFTKVLAPPDMKSLYRQYIPIYTGVFSRLSTLRQFNIGLTFKDNIIEILCNVFTLGEFLSILYTLILLLQGNILGIIFLFIQTITNLTILKRLSFKNIIYGIVGYYIRLSLYLNFIWVKLFTQVDLSKYKTPR